MGDGEGPRTPHYRLNGVHRSALRCHETPLRVPQAGPAEALLQLGFDRLRNVMFNEPTIALKPAVLQEAIGKAREGLGGA